MATKETLNGKNLTFLIKCGMCCMIAIFTNLSVNIASVYKGTCIVYIYSHIHHTHIEMSGWMLNDVNDEN